MEAVFQCTSRVRCCSIPLYMAFWIGISIHQLLVTAQALKCNAVHVVPVKFIAFQAYVGISSSTTSVLSDTFNMCIPNELWLKIFEFLPLLDLFSAYSANQHWRSLISTWRADCKESLRLSLFSLALKDIDKMPDVTRQIGLSRRIAYTARIEARHNITIPEPYRTVLTEWPSRRPVPGFCWPDISNHYLHPDTGECICRFDTFSGDTCQRQQVEERHLHIRASLLNKIRRHAPFDYHADDESEWELFDNPPRLYTDEQNESTRRFIRAHPESMWKREGEWEKLSMRCLNMVACYHGSDSGGRFCLILDGPARGEIHGWSYGGYQGIEAKSYLGWNFTGWTKQDEGIGE